MVKFYDFAICFFRYLAALLKYAIFKDEEH